jgi:hypothetical protein
MTNMEVRVVVAAWGVLPELHDPVLRLVPSYFGGNDVSGRNAMAFKPDKITKPSK